MFLNNLTAPVALAAELAANEKAAPFSAEAWLYAGEMTLLGMGMIFAVLASLWLVLVVFKLIFARDSAPKKTEMQNAVAKVVEESVAVAEEAPAAEADDTELVAILTAAIAAYRASEGTKDAEGYDGGFRVVSFRRVRNTRK